MNGVLIKKVGIFLAYALFAGFSTFMTATSVQMKWMSQFNFWIVFIMFFIVALCAGWCLNKAIKQIKAPNVSISVLVLSILGFLLFWGFSFITNVHYNLVQKKGVENLNTQLEHCMNYLQASDGDALNKNDEDFRIAKLNFLEKFDEQRTNFTEELRRELPNSTRYGLGPDAINDLQNIERFLNSIEKSYGGTRNYTGRLYDEEDKPYGKYNDLIAISDKVQPHFIYKIDRAGEDCSETIEHYFERKKINIISNKQKINDLKFYKKKLDSLSNDNSIYLNEYYMLFKEMNKTFSSIDGYKETYEIYKTDEKGKFVKDSDGNKIVIGYKDIYPSERMFDVMCVWQDCFSGRLPDNISLSGEFLISFIVDIISFILISLL